MSTDTKMTGRWRVGAGKPVLERRMPSQNHRTKAHGSRLAAFKPYLLLLLFPLLFSLCETVGWGQAMPIAPDCQLFLSFSTAATTATFDNRAQGCVSWTLQYTSTGFSGLTLTFQSAQGAATPGTFGAYGGTLVTGDNPMSSLTGEVSTFVNGTVNIPWVNVKLSSLTGSGNVTGVLYGYKSGSGGGGGGGGGGCPSATPCVVVGPTAAGSAPTTDPVLVAGQDGTDVRTVKTDTGGDVLVAGGAAVGAAIKNPVVGGAQNSAGNTVAEFACDKAAAVSISASGLVQIIAASAGKSVRICHLDFSLSAASNITIVSGTQVSTPCDTTPVNLSGVYASVLTFAQDYNWWGALTPAASQAVCLNVAGSVTGGGLVTYAVF